MFEFNWLDLSKLSYAKNILWCPFSAVVDKCWKHIITYCCMFGLQNGLLCSCKRPILNCYRFASFPYHRQFLCVLFCVLVLRVLGYARDQFSATELTLVLNYKAVINVTPKHSKNTFSKRSPSQLQRLSSKSRLLNVTIILAERVAYEKIQCLDN